LPDIVTPRRVSPCQIVEPAGYIIKVHTKPNI
jgi:hypothetical protein